MLQVGSKFKQAYHGCKDPITFTVLEIDKERDYLKVECTGTDGYSHIEEWQGHMDGLEFTEQCIEMGEYALIN